MSEMVEVARKDVVAQSRVVEGAIRSRVVLQADRLSGLPRHHRAQLRVPQHYDPLALLDSTRARPVVSPECGAESTGLSSKGVSKSDHDSRQRGELMGGVN